MTKNLSAQLREQAALVDRPYADEIMREAADLIDEWDVLSLVQISRDNQRLRAALSASRGQWIHSVNARQCLEALGEPSPDEPSANAADWDKFDPALGIPSEKSDGDDDIGNFCRKHPAARYVRRYGCPSCDMNAPAYPPSRTDGE